MNNYKLKWKRLLCHWSIALVIFCIVIILWGCATKKETAVEYKQVLIPVKCKVKIPEKPQIEENPIKMNLSILQYAEKLEIAIRNCR